MYAFLYTGTSDKYTESKHEFQELQQLMSFNNDFKWFTMEMILLKHLFTYKNPIDVTFSFKKMFLFLAVLCLIAVSFPNNKRGKSSKDKQVRARSSMNPPQHIIKLTVSF